MNPPPHALWLAPAVFLAAYALFVALPRRRAMTAIAGAALLVLSGVVPWRTALFELISWNVVGLFFGTLILAELFMQSRMPAVIAEWMLRRTRTAAGAMLMLCVLSSTLSMFLENVAVVLLVAPVAVSLCRRVGVAPVRLMILIAVCSNLQGTATLIGDPPSMILAGAMKLSFNDFFVYRGRPSIFFVVQIGALASFLSIAVLLRRHRTPIETIEVERPRSLVPTLLLGLLVVGLMTTHRFDPGFRWMAGALAMGLGAVGLAWYLRVPHWGSLGRLIRTLDWDTTLFLAGVFVLVGGLSGSGWLERLAGWLAGWTGGSVATAFVLLLALSIAVSGFVDNVPFLVAMLPVAGDMARRLELQQPALLFFALLVGACLGGNITPIGASANIVAIGLLRREGHRVSFGEFVRIGLPFTLAAVAAAGGALWWIWR